MLGILLSYSILVSGNDSCTGVHLVGILLPSYYPDSYVFEYYVATCSPGSKTYSRVPCVRRTRVYGRTAVLPVLINCTAVHVSLSECVNVLFTIDVLIILSELNVE